MKKNYSPTQNTTPKYIIPFGNKSPLYEGDPYTVLTKNVDS